MSDLENPRTLGPAESRWRAEITAAAAPLEIDDEVWGRLVPALCDLIQRNRHGYVSTVAKALRGIDPQGAVEMVAHEMRVVGERQITNGELVCRIFRSLADRVELLPYDVDDEDVEQEDPEMWCQRCTYRSVVWSAQSPVWNAVVRGGSINGAEEYNYLCPTCFCLLAQSRGVASMWTLRADDVQVELELVTPSGRIWDDAAMKFIEPSSDHDS